MERYYELKCAAAGLNPAVRFSPGKKASSGSDIPVLNPDIKGSPGYFSSYFEEKLGEDFLDKYKGVRPDFVYGNVGYYETLNYVDGHNTL